jgi:hypothetical protein
MGPQLFSKTLENYFDSNFSKPSPVTLPKNKNKRSGLFILF